MSSTGERVAGRQVLLELHGCDCALLDDVYAIESLMRRAATIAGTRVIGAVFHRFEPQGVTGILALAESHLSVHTWPDQGYAAVDLFSCGQGDIERAVSYIEDAFKAARSHRLLISRGTGGLAGDSRWAVRTIGSDRGLRSSALAKSD